MESTDDDDQALLVSRSGNDDDSFIRNHPLLNPIVMSNVAKYLEPIDLVSLRATCKAWNEVLIPELRKRGPIVCLNSGGDGSFGSVSDFMTRMAMASSSTFPFGRIKIELNSSYSDSSIHAFLTTYGQYIIYFALVLQNHPINIDTFRDMLFKQLPGLQEFVLDQSGSQTSRHFWRQDRLWSSSTTPVIVPGLLKLTLSIDVRGSEVALDFLTDLFNACINLGSLKITDSHWSNNKANASTVLVALKKSSARLAQLKYLALDEDVTQSELLLLTELGCRAVNALQLQEFQFVHKGMYNTPDEVTFAAILQELGTFIGTQVASLESFEFKTYYKEVYQLELPTCPKLKSLTFNLSWRLGQCINMKHFPARFPCLQVFDYSDVGDGRSPELQFIQEEVDGSVPTNDHLQLTPLQELKVEPIHTLHELLQLMTLFPKLTKSYLYIYSSSLNVLGWIWGSWKNLQILHIEQKGFELINNDDDDDVDGWGSGYGGIDEIITGIPQAHHSAITRMLQEGRKDDGDGDDEWSTATTLKKVLVLKTKPGISELTNLREFKLRFNAFYDRVRRTFFLPPPHGRPLSFINDISFYAGFALLSKTLVSIDIDCTEHVSTNCKEFLKTTLDPDAKILLHSDKARD